MRKHADHVLSAVESPSASTMSASKHRSKVTVDLDDHHDSESGESGGEETEEMPTTTNEKRGNEISSGDESSNMSSSLAPAGNAGWASAMMKVLKTGSRKKVSKTKVILSKAIKDKEIE